MKLQSTAPVSHGRIIVITSRAIRASIMRVIWSGKRCGRACKRIE